MSESKITTEIHNEHILKIGLNRPAKRNAFDLEMYHDLCHAYTQLEDDPNLWCGVLFAHGDHFTGGLDLAQWAPAMQDGNFPSIPDDTVDPLGIIGRHRTKPIIVAVQGYCFTIGIELLLACDIRVVAPNTHFAQIEIKRGIYPVGGATIRLQREVGWGNAMRYLLTGDGFGADEAYRIGLIQEIADDAPARAIELAEVVAKQAPLGVYATLRSAFITVKDGDAAAKADLMPTLRPIFDSEDAQEGVASFVERREANFKGR